jgi:hypothetical protein
MIINIASAIFVLLYGAGVGMMLLSLTKNHRKNDESDSNLSPLLFIASSFFVGAGGVTLAQFLLSLVGVPISASLLLFTPIAFFGWWINRFAFLKKPVITIDWKLASWIGVVFLLAIFFLRASGRTIYVWDGVAFWLPKIYALWQDQRVFPSTFIEFNHPEYPLLLPMIGANVFTVLGQANEVAAKSALFAFTIAGIVAFTQFILKKLPSHWVIPFLFSSLLIYIFREHVAGEYVGTADILVGFYLMMGTIHLLEKRVVLAIITWCFAPWAKTEGMIWVLASSGMIFLLFKEARKSLFIFLPFLAFPWSVYNRAIGFSSQYFKFDELYPRPWIDYAVYSIHAFREEFRNLEKWGLAFYLFFAVTILRFKKILFDKALVVLFVAAGAQVFAYMIIFTIAPEEQASFIAASVSRLTLHIAFSVLCITAYIIGMERKQLNGAKAR